MFDNAPGVNQFNGVKGVDASVRSQIVGWNDKIREYLRDFFNDDIFAVQGTRFGDNISKITYITERVVMEPDAFRGVRDVQGRLQAGAIVEEEFDCLYVDAFFCGEEYTLLQHRKQQQQIG